MEDLSNIPILERKVSWFANMRDKEPKETTLGEFLAMGSQYRDMIDRLRSCRDADERRYIKSQLPQATVSGVFFGSRKADNLAAHSGLVCIDIDAKDNPDYPDFEHLKENVLKHISEVAYAAHSVGGKGYFVIIPLMYPRQHKRHFAALQKDFAKLGITIDSACSDVSRLRSLSYDDEPFISKELILYKGLDDEPKPVVRPFQSYNWFRGNHVDKTDERVFMACKAIAERHIDMTANYSDWVNIGLALASLGEEGREYYHIVSCQNENYRPDETDKKFDNLLRNRGRITIGTFFYYCERFGIG